MPPDSRIPPLGVGIRDAVNADDVLARTVEAVLSEGAPVETYRVEEPDKISPSRELIAYSAVLEDPRARIVVNRARLLNIVGALARFVWMVSGSDRLQDIAFYEPKVQGYTDNGLSVPGSSYGMRLFQPRPGLNQIEAVVDRLSKEVGSRRGGAVIWAPDDAVRESKDIPCAFGMFFHNRGGRLVTTTVMRSNNAVTLLPFNIFEFSLVGELVASSIALDLGPYVHFAASMHVYDEARDWGQKIVAEYRKAGRAIESASMPPMPSSPLPLEQVRRLAQLEARLRHSYGDLTSGNTGALLQSAINDLDPYWLAFFRVLASYTLLKSGKFEAAVEVASELPAYFRESTLGILKASMPQQEQQGQMVLFGDARRKIAEQRSTIREIFGGTREELVPQFELLGDLCSLIEEDTGDRITRQEYQLLSRRMLLDRVPLAARSDVEDELLGADARFHISREDVEEELRLLRTAR
jgi:hypothetical protein